jgi:hypothetical protein
MDWLKMDVPIVDLSCMSAERSHALLLLTPALQPSGVPPSLHASGRSTSPSWCCGYTSCCSTRPACFRGASRSSCARSAVAHPCPRSHLAAALRLPNLVADERHKLYLEFVTPAQAGEGNRLREYLGFVREAHLQALESSTDAFAVAAQ